MCAQAHLHQHLGGLPSARMVRSAPAAASVRQAFRQLLNACTSFWTKDSGLAGGGAAAPARTGQKAMFASDPRRGIGPSRAGLPAAGSGQRAAQQQQHARRSTAQHDTAQPDAARLASEPDGKAGPATLRSTSREGRHNSGGAATAPAAPHFRSMDAPVRAAPASAMAGDGGPGAAGRAQHTQAAPPFGPLVEFYRWRLTDRPPSPRRPSRSTKSQACIPASCMSDCHDTDRCLLHSATSGSSRRIALDAQSDRCCCDAALYFLSAAFPAIRMHI